MIASLATVIVDMLKQAQLSARDAPLRTLDFTEGLGDKDDVVELSAAWSG